jgi:hypothetical protein
MKFIKIHPEIVKLALHDPVIDATICKFDTPIKFNHLNKTTYITILEEMVINQTAVKMAMVNTITKFLKNRKNTYNETKRIVRKN